MKGKSDMWHYEVAFWMVYLLLPNCGLSHSCGNAKYLIDGKCCPMCKPGTHVYRHCTEYTSTSCAPCMKNFFKDVPSGLISCSPCSVCDAVLLGLKTERECNVTSDTVCVPLDQYYCTQTDNERCRFAQKHTICRPGQFIKRNGTTWTNTECGECPHGTFSNKSFSAFCKPHTDCQSLGLQEITAGTNTSNSECEPMKNPGIIIAVSVALGVIVMVVIAAAIFKWRSQIGRNKRRDQPTNEERTEMTAQL